jgi:3-oxoacyl-[acyl-carrier protein] reductase
MDLELEGHGALVTASSSGLGKGAATALAREGCDVVINGRDEEKLQAAAEDIRTEADGEVVAIAGDLSEEGVPQALVDETVDRFGRLDHLVTNAGGPPHGWFRDTTDEDWYHAFDLLVMSTVRLVRAADEHLRNDGGGTIVNITSITVKEALDSLVLSNAVRMAVVGLEKTLSTEFAPEVRVNAVLPGTIETERVTEAIEHGIAEGTFDSYEEGVAGRVEETPLDRMGDPIELGELVAYLSSPRSSYVNGASVVVDGGASASNL